VKSIPLFPKKLLHSFGKDPEPRTAKNKVGERNTKSILGTTNVLGSLRRDVSHMTSVIHVCVVGPSCHVRRPHAGGEGLERPGVANRGSVVGAC
jgi:hypothetical protein